MSCISQRILTILFFTLIGFAAIAQKTIPGYYSIKSYTSKNYRFHPRNFYIFEDSRRMIYAGNAYGVLEFDGINWKTIGLVNSESALCLLPTADGKKYVGANGEAGYIMVDSTGKMRYHSLGNKMPADKSAIGSIYNIFSVGNELFFCGGSKALVYKNGVFRWFSQEGQTIPFDYAQKVGNSMYFYQKEKGLMQYQEDHLVTIPSGDLLKGLNLVKLLKEDDKQLLVVTDKELFLFNGRSLMPLSSSNHVLRNHKMSHALKLTNGNTLVTTHDAGAFIFDKQGALLKQLTQEHGLQSNNINHAYCDQRGNLWLALDNGIAFVEVNTAFTFLEHSSGLSGMGMAATVYKDRLYLGTSQGLYYCTWNEHVKEYSFNPVKGISGQVWSLTVANGMLICNHISRLYTIQEDQATPLFTAFPDKGNWKTLVLKKHPGYALVGTYNGLHLYQLQQGSIQYLRKLEGFEEACRTFIEETDGSIWVAHGNKGLYRLFLDSNLTAVTSENHSLKNGFKPDFFNHVNYFDQQIVFASDNGPYTYDPKKDRLIYNTSIAQYFGSDYLNKFYQFDNQHIILFKNGTDIVLFRKKQTTYEKDYFLLKKLHRSAVGSYEFAHRLNEQYTIIGTEQGFTLFNTEFNASKNKSFQVVLRSITAPFHQDSTLFYGNTDPAKATTFELPYSLNSIRLSYSSNFYESIDKTSYQYAWVKNDHPLIWSSWTNKTELDLNDLREGNYTLHIRARNVYYSMSEEAIYTFRILPPWYRSLPVYIVYIFLLCIAIYFLFLWIKKRFHKQRYELEQKYLIHMLQKDKELHRLQTEALEEKLILQNNELTSMAALLNQRSELLSLLHEKVQSFEAQYPTFDSKLVEAFVHSVNQQSTAEHTWIIFQTQFDNLHQDFLKRFKEKHPKLDESWLLLCAYIRMNKSYKEISNHLNISVAGVDKRLYRLKDKLELSADIKIREYIQYF